MGGRLLKRWLALPLKDINKIRNRHEVVSYLKDNQAVLVDLGNGKHHIITKHDIISSIK